MEQVDDGQFLARGYLQWEHNAIRHIAIEGGAVKANIAHNYFRCESRMVRPRLLLPVTSGQKHQTKSEARGGNSRVPGRLHRGAMIAQREHRLRRGQLIGRVHARSSAGEEGRGEVVVIRGFSFAVPEKRVPQL